MIRKREDYIDWDTYFMLIAKISAKRSKDPNTQVGACIVLNNKIVGVGYNGAPNGFDDDNMPWERDTSLPLQDTKYAYVCHAELNAILNKINTDITGATIYVDLFPCNECAKAIVQSGIKKVIYESDKYDGTPANIASKRILDECGIIYEQLDKICDIKIDVTKNKSKIKS